MFFERMLPYVIPGIIYGIGAIGIALIFRYLRFPDFTALGSIMVGGIVCIYVANSTNPYFGIVSGTVIGGGLGFVTGILAQKLRIQPVLAGIITFTGSYSIGYLLAENGVISLSFDKYYIISPTFESGDVVKMLLVSICLCGLISILMRTKFGSLLIAMSSSRRFLLNRHRYRTQIFVTTTIIGNAIVSFCGSLYALHDQTAYVYTHIDFLPYSLGAIFGGNAISVWVSKRLNRTNSLQTRIDVMRTTKRTKVYEIISNAFNDERDDSSRIGFLFFTYMLGCIFLKEVSGLVHANAFKEIHESLAVPPNIQYIIIAILITLFVWWAQWEE